MEDSASSLPSIWASMNSWFTPTVLFLFLNLMIGTILFTSTLPNHNHNNNNNNKQEDHNDKTHNQNESKLARSPSILYRLKSFNFYPHRSQPETSPATHHHHQQQQQQQEALEIAATQYVFNHPFSHEHDAQQVSSNPNDQDLNPPRFHESESESDQYEVLLANAQTHFVFEQNHTVEKVTAHFDVGSENLDPEDPTHEEENDQFQSLDEVYSIITGGHVNRTKSDTLPAAGEVPVKLPAKMKKSASLKSAFNHFEEEKIVEARRPATVRERSASRATEEDDVEVDAKADDFINKFKNQLKLQRLDSIIRYKDMVNRGTGK